MRGLIIQERFVVYILIIAEPLLSAFFVIPSLMNRRTQRAPSGAYDSIAFLMT